MFSRSENEVLRPNPHNHNQKCPTGTGNQYRSRAQHCSYATWAEHRIWDLIKSDSLHRAKASKRCMHQHKSVCGESHANPRMFPFAWPTSPADLKFEFVVASSSALRQTSHNKPNTQQKGQTQIYARNPQHKELIFMDAGFAGCRPRSALKCLTNSFFLQRAYIINDSLKNKYMRLW